MLRRRRRREPVVLPVPSATATSSGLNLDPAPASAASAVAVPTTTAASAAAAANPCVPEQEQTLFKDLRSTVGNRSRESKRIPPQSELIEPKLKGDWFTQDPKLRKNSGLDMRVN